MEGMIFFKWCLRFKTILPAWCTRPRRWAVGQLVNDLRPLNDRRKITSSWRDSNSRPQAHHIQALTIRAPPLLGTSTCTSATENLVDIIRYFIKKFAYVIFRTSRQRKTENLCKNNVEYLVFIVASADNCEKDVFVVMLLFVCFSVCTFCLSVHLLVCLCIFLSVSTITQELSA